MVGELYARDKRRVKAGPGDRYPTDNKCHARQAEDDRIFALSQGVIFKKSGLNLQGEMQLHGMMRKLIREND